LSKKASRKREEISTVRRRSGDSWLLVEEFGEKTTRLLEKVAERVRENGEQSEWYRFQQVKVNRRDVTTFCAKEKRGGTKRRKEKDLHLSRKENSASGEGREEKRSQRAAPGIELKKKKRRVKDIEKSSAGSENRKARSRVRHRKKEEKRPVAFWAKKGSRLLISGGKVRKGLRENAP